MPTIFFTRVTHAVIFLVKSNVGTSLMQISACKSPSKEDLRVEHQLDDMIEIMANWGSDWPACRLIQVLTTLRRQLRDNQNKVAATCDSSSRNSCTSHQDETQSSSPTFPEPPTPFRYLSLAQQDLNLRPPDFSVQEGPSYGDSSFWEALPQSLSHSYAWKAQQPQLQPQATLSEENFSSEFIPPTGLFTDNSQHELHSVLYKNGANTRDTANTSNLRDYIDPLLSMENILTP